MRLSGKVFAACGFWMLLLGVYFIVLRPALLPEDRRFMGTSIEALRAAAPGLVGSVLAPNMEAKHSEPRPDERIESPSSDLAFAPAAANGQYIDRSSPIPLHSYQL